MESNDFDKLVQIQAELVDQILTVENEITQYQRLERDMITKRERELYKSMLGCKDEQVETEFAIHYIQVKLQQKKSLHDHLTKAFQHRSQEFINLDSSPLLQGVNE
ncbi:hypothetical protein H1D32_03770 [Anaerobacillus sp. CMMVII]|uniref:hypothetical protein n=1 Tax=Anaerobacillus sp. CMMVII TaxID=2755588 RepID=UPI0021B78997|nr:hypothetical protein [Anaerobacillus sp. CMMVII]MCT8136949.1 hypothetical protein [Anaerobacillus sp. CMMVII]